MIKEFFDFVKNEFTPRVRVIVEGGSEGGLNIYNVLGINARIPKGVTRVKIKEDLDLVGRLGQKGLVKVEESKEPKVLELSQNYISGLTRPYTLITEDGRVFYDRKLSGSRRLDNFLRIIYDHYDGRNLFRRMYAV